VKNAFVRTSMIVALTVMSAALASAQTTVELPNNSQQTLLTATVSEQARIIVPESIQFNVTNTSAITDASASVTVTNIALATASKQLQISLAAAALSFTPSVVGGTTWASSNVSWDAVAFSNAGVGTAGALAGVGTYNVVQTCAVNVTACSTTDLPFHLAAKPTVNYAGSHTLLMTWKFASIGA
jgi:hypothetical protein